MYAFWLPVMVGWGVAACNWFNIVSGTILIFVLAAVRVPREEAMMLQGFGESYRDYMIRTGRFTRNCGLYERNGDRWFTVMRGSVLAEGGDLNSRYPCGYSGFRERPPVS